MTVNDAIVGLIQFSEEDDPEYRHATIDVYLDPAAHRRGHATDALATVARHLFDELEHHCITIDPAAANTAAIACYSRLGFRTVGTMRSYEQRSDGTWADGLLMELLATDFIR
jgi:aminoglycoside 6'-N-acetyltransferase